MVAQTAVLYNEKRLIPAPIVSFSKSYRRSGDQSIVGAEHRATITGTLVGCKGWDFTSGEPEFYDENDYPADGAVDTCSKFISIVQMQDKMRELFALDNEYKWFEIVGCGPENPIRKWRARVADISFDEGQWTDICSYTIVLSLQTDAITDEELYIDHAETWSTEFDEERGGTYSLSHTLSCSSEEFVNDSSGTEGWQIAKQWIEDRISGSGYSTPTPITIKNSYVFSGSQGIGFDIPTDYNAYDYSIQKSLDEYGGSYSITENWILAKDPVFRRWSLNFSKPRDDFSTISMEGEFTSFLDRTDGTNEPTNSEAAWEAFETWEAADGPYNEASGYYSEVGATGTLGSCSVNRTISRTEESRGDGSVSYGAETRSVKFNYEFSDSDNGADVSTTTTLSKSLLESCESRVSVQSNIQGHECGEYSKIENARIAADEIDTASISSGVYDGAGELTLVSSSTSENERDGTISISDEFSDKLVDGMVQEEVITEAWACGDIGSDGDSKTLYSVNGTRKWTCGTDEAELIPPATGDYSSIGGVALTIKKTTVSTDSTNGVVTYAYELDDDVGIGLVEITTDTSRSSDSCSTTSANVSFAAEGYGCNSTDKLANATSLIDALEPSSYVPAGYSQVSQTTNINQTRGTIQASYGYSSDTSASLEVTITESSDSSDCDKIIYSVEGEIVGRCFLGVSQIADAESVFSTYTTDYYATSLGATLVSSSVSKNDKRGTIRYSYSYSNTDEEYEEEQTISTNVNEQEGTTEVTISGTITPLCGTGSQVSIGNAAWTTVEATLEGLANIECDTSSLSSSTLSKNTRNGQIQYSHTYLCTGDMCFTGAIRESVTISRDAPSDVVAIVPILGRACGPLIQDKSTKTAEVINITIDVLYPRNEDCSYDKPTGLPDPEEIITAMGYCSDGGFVQRDTDSWNPLTGKYVRNYSKICECCVG